MSEWNVKISLIFSKGVCPNIELDGIISNLILILAESEVRMYEKLKN